MIYIYIIFFITIISIPIVSAIKQSSYNKKLEEKFVNGTATEAEKEEFRRKINDDVARNRAFIASAAIQRKRSTIRKTIIVNQASDSRKKVGSTVIRGAVGNALLGPVGLVGGALSVKNKVTNTTTFLIEYADGHRETKVVNNSSSEFEKLCKYLET